MPTSSLYNVLGVFFSFVVVDKVGLNGLQSTLIVALESVSYSIAGNAWRTDSTSVAWTRHFGFSFSAAATYIFK